MTAKSDGSSNPWPRSTALLSAVTVSTAQTNLPTVLDKFPPIPPEARKKKLDRTQYHVTQERGTEPAFQNAHSVREVREESCPLIASAARLWLDCGDETAQRRERGPRHEVGSV